MADSHPHQKRKKSSRYSPTQVERTNAEKIREQVLNFDWSVHCEPLESPKAAQARHFQSIREAHHHVWEGHNGRNTNFPTTRQLYQDPFWYENPMNAASLPIVYRHTYWQPQQWKNNKTEVKANRYGEGFLCAVCTRKKEVDQPRCYDCYLMSLEYVWFTFHPRSEYSGIDPHRALLLIDMCLHKNWTVMELSSQLHADHATDYNPDELVNRKSAKYSRLRSPKRRFQEIKLGSIHFTDANSHMLKTYQANDCANSSKEMQALWQKRKKATDDFVVTIDVEDLMEFTVPLRDEKHGGFNFNLKEFMWHVRKHWMNNASVLQLPPEVTFTADYILAERTSGG